MYELKNKIILITGATGKLTRVIAHYLAKTGADLALHYHNHKEQADELNEKIKSIGTRCKLYRFDLLVSANPEKLAQQVLSDFGRVDILINAVSRFAFSRIEQTDDELWDEMLKLNITVPFKLVRALAENFHNLSGSIVNIADIWGIRPKANFIAYSVAKSGLIGLTKALAETFAPNTTVNAIAPGIIDFPDDIDENKRKTIMGRIPLSRPAYPEEVAQAVIGVITNRYMTGQIIAVDGGRLL